MSFTPPHLLNKQWKNLRVGLFGGSFNPAHEGHRHVAHIALKTRQFDFIWWMVTPGNPLKRHHRVTTPSVSERMQGSRQLLHHPRIIVTNIEEQLGTDKSIDTIRSLKKQYPNTHFTFIAGTDNALHLHLWEEWQALLKEVPFLFVGRPPALDLIRKAPVKLLRSADITWIYQTKLVAKSSTEIRKQQRPSA